MFPVLTCVTVSWPIIGVRVYRGFLTLPPEGEWKTEYNGISYFTGMSTTANLSSPVHSHTDVPCCCSTPKVPITLPPSYRPYEEGTRGALKDQNKSLAAVLEQQILEHHKLLRFQCYVGQDHATAWRTVGFRKETLLSDEQLMTSYRDMKQFGTSYFLRKSRHHDDAYVVPPHIVWLQGRLQSAVTVVSK